MILMIEIFDEILPKMVDNETMNGPNDALA